MAMDELPGLHHADRRDFAPEAGVSGGRASTKQTRPALKDAMRAAVLGFVLAQPLSGCAAGPDFVAPAAPAGGGYATVKFPTITQSAPVAGGATQRLVDDRDVPGEWWKLFQSKQIVALVNEAIANHPDIAAAEAALRLARETAAADAGMFLPQASFSNSVTRQQISAAQYGGSPVSGSGSSGSSGSAPLYTLFNTNVSVSFTPDVFGKTARMVEADLASADYQRFQLEAAYLTLTANVVSTAIADASYAAQIRVTRDLIATYQAQLDLLEKRFELGAVSQADVLSERASLAQAQATLPPLEKARAQTRDQLMAYLGRFPNTDKGEAVDLESLRLPRELPLSLPSNLVRQRPDVRSVESQLHEASARIGVATANMLPQITLSASGGSQALSIDKLFGPQMAAWSLGGALAGQVFDGGVLFHRREASVAAFEQSAAKYKSTVIGAFQNVADVLQAIKHDAGALRSQVIAENAAAKSLEIARAQYRAGSTTYWTVLNAEQTLLNARLNRVKAQAARFGDTTALFQALGGGWWNRIDETPASQPKPADLISTVPIAAAIRATVEDSQNVAR
jgi:NodT family efflux transporter outer membrane factor (OMF) lipoprotein